MSALFLSEEFLRSRCYLVRLIMVAWDLANDPVWANINRLWVWQHSGAYLGVPVTNFLGWYLVVYLIYQSFAIYLRGHTPVANPLPSGYWHWAVIFYALSAAGTLLLLFRSPRQRWFRCHGGCLGM